MKLTKRAREVLFPNPCIWASSGDAVPSPVQARDEERRRQMGGRGSQPNTDDEHESESESERQLKAGIPRIPPPSSSSSSQKRRQLPPHAVSEPKKLAGYDATSSLDERKGSVPSLPPAWEDYAFTGGPTPSSGGGMPAPAPPEVAQGSTVLSQCDKKIGKY
jgi:hypothetical protein